MSQILIIHFRTEGACLPDSDRNCTSRHLAKLFWTVGRIQGVLLENTRLTLFTLKVAWKKMVRGTQNMKMMIGILFISLVILVAAMACATVLIKIGLSLRPETSASRST